MMSKLTESTLKDTTMFSSVGLQQKLEDAPSMNKNCKGKSVNNMSFAGQNNEMHHKRKSDR